LLNVPTWQRIVAMTRGSLSCRMVCAALRPVSAAVGRCTGSVIVSAVRTRERLVALTIDDGPHLATTPALLDVLRRHRATATFFLIGERVLANDQLLPRIVCDGHELANHLMRDEPTVLLGRPELRMQLQRVDSLLSPHGPVRFFRPGSGWLSPAVLREGAERGYRCAMGSPLLIATEYPDPAALGRRLAQRSHEGAVVILHEGTEARSGVTETASVMLEQLASRGYRAVSLTELCHRQDVG
jgi:peptidoglycan/xylan/chitin deacetylase (PgdA/CDA1 family)